MGWIATFPFEISVRTVSRHVACCGLQSLQERAGSRFHVLAAVVAKFVRTCCGQKSGLIWYSAA